MAMRCCSRGTARRLTSAADRADGLHLTLEYRTALYQPATIDRLAEHFGTILEQIAESADHPVSALRLMGPAERSQTLALSAGPVVKYPNGETLRDLLHAQ